MSIYNFECWEARKKNYELLRRDTEYTLIEDLPFADFTFKCTDGEVKAHKCILWARCSMFKTSVWDISSMAELEVDCNTVVMQKVIDFFYGRDGNFLEPLDIAAFKVMNMLNPRLENIRMLIPVDTSTWNNILDQSDEFGYTRETIVDEMTKHVLNTTEGSDVYKSTLHLNAEIIKCIFKYNILDSDCMLFIIDKQFINGRITNEEAHYLCSLIHWEYMIHSARYINKEIVDCVPTLSNEAIRQAYLVPKYQKHHKGIKEVLRYSTNFAHIYIYTNVSYEADYMQVLGRYIPLRNVFKDAKEFDDILARDKNL